MRKWGDSIKPLLIMLIMLCVLSLVSCRDTEGISLSEQHNNDEIAMNKNEDVDHTTREPDNTAGGEEDLLYPSSFIDYEWQFQSELSHVYLLEGTEDYLLIYGHDGQISGYHDESILYAVERATGKKLWQVNGGYEGVSFRLHAEELQATILTEYNQQLKKDEIYLRHVDIVDGSVIWEKYFDLEMYPGGVSMIDAGDAIITYNYMMLDQNISTFQSWDKESGSLFWSKQLSEPYEVLNGGGSVLLLKKNGIIHAYHPTTGEEIWDLHGSVELDYESRQSFRFFREARFDPFQAHDRDNWIFFSGERLRIDMETGSIVTRYQSRSGEAIFSVDERYWLVQDNEVPSTPFTTLYDTVNQRELWSVSGRASEPTKDGDVLFLMIDGVPAAINWSDGSMIWQHDGKEVSPFELTYGGNFIVLDHQLVLLPYGEELLVIDKATGEVRQRLDEFDFNYPISLERYSRGGLINIEGEDLFIGSSNGIFSKTRVESFANKWK